MNKNIKTILLGIGAGAAIAVGGLLNITAKALFDNPEIGRLIGSLLFPIGLTMVCYLGLNLYTGKIGYLLDNDKKYVVFLLLVYLGNIIGSLVYGFICYFIFKNVPVIYETAKAIASNKANIFDFLSGVKMFAGSILCGALVYLAVFSYKTFNKHVFKVLGIFIAIAIFVYFGFDHCVANMFYFTFGLSFGCWKSYLNILLATIGNSLGAIALNEVVAIIKKYKAKSQQ